MKIRLAKKIWNRPMGKMSLYWINKFVKADKTDYRITQASKKVEKWKGYKLRKRLVGL